VIKKRTIQTTVYVIMVLCETQTKTFVKDVYSEATFTFAIYADALAKPEELVTATMIHKRLNSFFERQEALPKLKTQYPSLPDFYIASGKLFSQEVFFDEIAETKG
jgi:hypothetical protein